MPTINGKIALSLALAWPIALSLGLAWAATNIPNHVQFGGVIHYRFAKSVPTTNDSWTTVLTIPTATNQIYHVEYDVVARQTAAASGAGYKRLCSYRNRSNTVTKIWQTHQLGTFENVGSWTASDAASGTNILIQVIGHASQTVRWDVVAKYWSSEDL